MAQSVGHLGRNFKPKRGGMAQSVEHIVHIDGVVGSSPTVTTEIPKPKWPGDLFYPDCVMN